MTAKPTTLDQYLAALPAERRAVLDAVRAVINANLDPGYEEGLQYGMPAWYVPHRLFPAGYHCEPRQPLPFAALAAQKQYYSLYLSGLYCGCDEGPGSAETADAQWFRQAWTASGRKLDMGKSCVRFKRLDDVPLEVVGQAIARVPVQRYIERYQQVRATAAASKIRRQAG